MLTRARTSPGLEVRTREGVVRGVRERGIEAWRGIPFAAPPVGALRFRGPRPPEPFTGIRDASRFGAVSAQSREGNFIGAAKNAPMGEDCLTLNIVRPARPAADTVSMRPNAAPDAAPLLPVMVFIHGGAYSVGSSSEVPRNGDTLARDGNVVYVSINYRLGALGFLDFTGYSTPERPIENNLGLKDCVAALEWIQANIREFGGDPLRVTLFGESAGANAVTTLMTVPRASGLFARAIAQSSPTNAVYPPDLTREWGAQFVELLSSRIANDSVENTTAEDAGEMLVTADWRDLVRATDALTTRAPDSDPGTIALCPVIDGDFLPERPLDAFKAGRAHPIPLIIGTNDREGALFTGRLDILATTPQRIRAIFSKTKKKARKAIKAEYPGLPAKRPAADFGGDYAFWYPTVKVAERHSRFAPVYFYRFDLAPRLVRLAGFDATHGLELFAVFDRLGSPFGHTMTLLGGRRPFLRAGARMRRYWSSFAYTGVPDARLPDSAREPASAPVPTLAADLSPASNLPQARASVPRTRRTTRAHDQSRVLDQSRAPHPSRALDQSRVLVWPRYDEARRRTLIIDSDDRIESDPRRSRRLAWLAFVPHV
ncbi:carboxylesterase/lipase family protein [Subtercola sp. RTI3]|uniref:carboxylesterase/lipase family protein n=1 Tax=Subtercola sp. RTI3 TaxID=3048639 RepID=UPI002B226F05|nr:carboxylesterase family protein [Subtercola sp. RTI3]MEA9984911.1 carboxylesterase family protein [Subtercola sp. RTI3]